MSPAELNQLELDFYLNTLYETLKGLEDTANAQILDHVRSKLNRQEIIVACFGYVSSGKSCLLNTLINAEDLLPVSPLTTSMNSVYIKPGKRSDMKKEEFHQLCQDAAIESHELNWDTPDGLTFIDTPGIDSIESGKKQAENPALLLADLVIYVTDFNRVESDINFSFLKTLESRRIPYLLVINQIDKHVSLELSLADFKARIHRTLEQWNLNPIDIFFTSLLNKQYAENQFDQLKKVMSGLIRQGTALVVSTVIRSVRQIIAAHSAFFIEQQGGLRESHLWVKKQALNELETVSLVNALEEKIPKLESLAQTIDSDVRRDIDKLLDYAPLFSFETRELIKHLLESRQPSFKVGVFGSAAKTRAEQDQRLQTLYEDLKARCEANLTWHLRTILTEIPARYELSLENYTDQVSQMTITFEPELLLQKIHTGAMVSGKYVLNYTQDLTDTIKAVYRQSSKVWIERAQEAANLKAQQELPGLQAELQYHRQVMKSLAQLSELDDHHDQYIAGLLAPWQEVKALFPEVNLSEVMQRLNRVSSLENEENEYKPKGDKTINESRTKPYTNVETDTEVAVKTVAVTAVQKVPDISMDLSKDSNTSVKRGHPKLRKTAQDLRKCAELLKLLPGFGGRVQLLEQRAERLEDNLFTVALFGAFSAGKSSLANALLGASVLPVSPNPTTATINKILPPTDQYPHGTAKVKLKSSADLTTDVLSSLAVLGVNVKDLSEALSEIPAIDSRDLPLEAKPHLSFLRAVVHGQVSLMEHIGQELTVDYTDFRRFVVQEDKACYVESIELYYACPLTALGVVLVDTPGSNSTNTRHTNVAFDYIKNADAVLFVTYYNNPFCKADAQFLSQLGKVKDAFEMDKLFFLVNAADLAQTPEELTMVVEHVEQNLRSCDIVRPRIFPVSSQLALLAKLALAEALQPQTEQLYRQRLKLSQEERLPDPGKVLFDSGLQQFERNFNSFIEEDLINLAVESAEKEIQRNFYFIANLLEAAKSDASQRLEKLQCCRTTEQNILSALDQLSFIAEKSAIGQELDELFYYVIQRLSHRYSNLFNRNFFRLMQLNVEKPKQAVQQCIVDFLQEIEVELGQEARATFLRVNRFLQKSINRVFSKHEEIINLNEPECSLQNEYKIDIGEEARFPQLSWNMNSFVKTPDLYKNPKEWVEGRGRDKMEEALIKIIHPQIQTWANECNELYKRYCDERFEDEIKKLKERIYSDIRGYFSSLAAAMADEYNIDVLERVLELWPEVPNAG